MGHYRRYLNEIDGTSVASLSFHCENDSEAIEHALGVFEGYEHPQARAMGQYAADLQPQTHRVADAGRVARAILSGLCSDGTRR
jgi:hypothetical protein